MQLICYNIVANRISISRQGDVMRLQISLLFLAIGTVAQADSPKVAVDIAPVHGLVAQVMEGVDSPDLVIPPGANPHGYAMRPSEAAALAQADIVFWVGPILTPWMAEPIETLAGQARHIALSEVDDIPLLDLRVSARFEAHDHDHDHGREDDHTDAGDNAHDNHGHDEHAHADDHGHDDHGHADAHKDEENHSEAEARTVIDGHMWLNPEVAALWVDEIARVLSEHDPENKSIYLANAETAQAELAALNADIAQQLAPVSDMPFIVFHDSYQYFENRFGVTAVAAVTIGDSGTASAARLAEVREVVGETGATCALAEPRASQGLIDAVAEGANITVTRVDAVGVDIPTGPAFYGALMRQLADGIANCLSGKAS